MATRAVWKGAISFGLVHIPVALHSAIVNTGLNFDWLDKRTMDPVGYKRINKGDKVYALLRDALLKSQRVGVARVVIQNKQHLAVLLASGPGLILNLLRWDDEIQSWESLELPPEGSKAAGARENANSVWRADTEFDRPAAAQFA